MIKCPNCNNELSQAKGGDLICLHCNTAYQLVEHKPEDSAKIAFASLPLGWSPSIVCPEYLSLEVLDNNLSIRNYTGDRSLILTIPSSYLGIPIVNIGDRAFLRCNRLYQIILPDSITSIGNDAFSECTNLMSIFIPNSVTYIGASAFCGCTELRVIKYQGSEQQWNAIEKGMQWDNETADYLISCSDTVLDKNGNRRTTLVEDEEIDLCAFFEIDGYSDEESN